MLALLLLLGWVGEGVVGVGLAPLSNAPAPAPDPVPDPVPDPALTPAPAADGEAVGAGAVRGMLTSTRYSCQDPNRSRDSMVCSMGPSLLPWLLVRLIGAPAVRGGGGGGECEGMGVRGWR